MEHAASPTRSLVLVCKRDFEAELVEEVQARTDSQAGLQSTGSGLVLVESALAAHAALRVPQIFERQRIEDAVRLPPEALKPMARAILRDVLRPVITSQGPWTAHVFAAEAPGAESLSVRARNLEQVLLDLGRERFGRAFRRWQPPESVGRGDKSLVLNLCLLPEGAWAGVMPAGRLSDPRPGGVHRMAFQQDAPARSYLKLEEAFDLMGEKPRPGQVVVDLGASPGGWTWACLKRGCRVTAVDNGAMRLKEPGRFGGTLNHLRENGVTYEPDRKDRPVDWLVSDMLITSGTNIGMLRKWFAGRWMRRFVVNIKIPQVHAYPVIRPIEDYLRTVPGVRFSIRQLYHDRREVTLYGGLEPAAMGPS